MRKIILAAVALTPLFGGVAFAQRSSRHVTWDNAAGPMASPDWQQQWAALPGYPLAQAHAPTRVPHGFAATSNAGQANG